MNSPVFSRPALAAAVSGALLLSLGGCGGGGSPAAPSTPSTTTPAQQVRTVLLSGVTFTVRAGTASFTNIDFPPVGRIDVTVSWGGSANVEAYVTDAACAGFAELTAGRCAVLARSEGTARPKALAFDSQTGRVYSVWTANRGTITETVALDAGVTTNGPIQQPPAQPTPNPTVTPDPRDGWAEGPVTQVKVYMKTLESTRNSREYRPAQQDDAGNWLVYPGEFIVIDSTQRNGAGLICKWIKDPVYSWDNEEDMMDIKGSSEPFFLKFEVAKKGYAEVTSQIDGIESNTLKILAVGRNN